MCARSAPEMKTGMVGTPQVVQGVVTTGTTGVVVHGVVAGTTGVVVQGVSGTGDLQVLHAVMVVVTSG